MLYPSNPAISRLYPFFCILIGIQSQCVTTPSLPTQAITVSNDKWCPIVPENLLFQQVSSLDHVMSPHKYPESFHMQNVIAGALLSLQPILSSAKTAQSVQPHISILATEKVRITVMILEGY